MATPRQSESVYAKRSLARRSSSPTSASSRMRRPRSSKRSARSSSATVVSSMPSAAEVAELEAVGADLWVAPEVEELDGWRLRFAHGLTGRGNSVLPNAGTLGVEEKIEQVEAWYAARGLPARYQITIAAQPGLTDALEARAYVPAGEPTTVEVAELPETKASVPLASSP